MGFEDLWGCSQYVSIYLSCVAGIVFSVILPIAVQAMPKVQRALSVRSNFEQVWIVARPYLKIGVASLIIGVVIVVYLSGTLTDPRIAFIAGYTWDSTLQKVKS